MDIIDKLIQIQNELNINQKSFANILEISPQAMSKILKRESKPALKTIINLCKLCNDNGISLNWLLLDEPIETKNNEIVKLYNNAKPEVQESVLLLLKAGQKQSEKLFDSKTG